MERKFPVINFRKFGYDPRVVKDISANIDWGLSKEPNCRVYLTITQSHYYEHTRLEKQ